MRRALMVLLMLLTFAQSSWAAVASLCLHETGASAQHIGHHVGHPAQQPASASAPAHDTAETSDVGVTGDSHAQGGLDADCAACHMATAALLPRGVMAPPVLGLGQGCTPYCRAVITSLLDPLIRPPLARLA